MRIIFVFFVLISFSSYSFIYKNEEQREESFKNGESFTSSKVILTFCSKNVEKYKEYSFTDLMKSLKEESDIKAIAGTSVKIGSHFYLTAAHCIKSSDHFGIEYSSLSSYIMDPLDFSINSKVLESEIQPSYKGFSPESMEGRANDVAVLIAEEELPGDSLEINYESAMPVSALAINVVIENLDNKVISLEELKFSNEFVQIQGQYCPFEGKFPYIYTSQQLLCPIVQIGNSGGVLLDKDNKICGIISALIYPVLGNQSPVGDGKNIVVFNNDTLNKSFKEWHQSIARKGAMIYLEKIEEELPAISIQPSIWDQKNWLKEMLEKYAK